MPNYPHLKQSGKKFMEKHAEVIASSGHKQETTVVKVLSDS